MKLKNLKINNFGKLKDKDIELNDGINIIYGENEAGKSTLLKFITSMLYGINRNKAGNYTSDYERYTPWDVSDFSGKISYELDDGKKFEVYRDFNKKAPKVFDENMEDISKTFTIDKTKGSRFFIDQTGVEEDLFLSTIVSEQQGVKLEAKEQSSMIQKMTNILGTGEDSISFQNTINKLNKKITNEIGTKNTKEKPLNVLEKKQKELEDEINNLEAFNEEKYAINDTKIEEERVIQEKEAQLQFANKIQEIENEYSMQKEKVKIAKEEGQERIRRELVELDEGLDKIGVPNLKKVNRKVNFITAGVILALGLIIRYCFKTYNF